MAELRAHFRPEFLNRIDDTVLFKPLTREEIEQIVVLQIHDVRRRLAERRIELDLTEDARRFIAEHAYDPVYGARPLRRYIQHEVETRIARALLSGAILDGARVTLDAGPDGLQIRWENVGEAEEVEAAVAGAPT